MALHQHLEGDETAEPGLAWAVSRLCEEFGLAPTGALRELDECPPTLLGEILECRAYARAKQALDRATSQADVPRTVWVDRVFEVESELWKQRTAAQAARERGA